MITALRWLLGVGLRVIDVWSAVEGTFMTGLGHAGTAHYFSAKTTSWRAYEVYIHTSNLEQLHPNFASIGHAGTAHYFSAQTTSWRAYEVYIHTSNLKQLHPDFAVHRGLHTTSVLTQFLIRYACTPQTWSNFSQTLQASGTAHYFCAKTISYKVCMHTSNLKQLQPDFAGLWDCTLLLC